MSFYERVLGFRQSHLVRRQGHQHRVLGPDVEGRVRTAAGGSSSRSTSRPRASGSRRSRSTSSSTAAPASSTSRWRPTTSSRTVPALRDRRSRSCGCPTTYYDMLPDRVGTIDEDLATTRRARHPGRSRRRGLPAPDLHQAGRGPADAVLRDHPAAGREELRQGQLQGAVRGDRARAGPQGESVATVVRDWWPARGNRFGPSRRGLQRFAISNPPTVNHEPLTTQSHADISHAGRDPA